MKLERLLAIIMLLINRGRVTAGELAEYFEVSVRTIYRDLETINQAGIPIVSYQGANGGYGIMDTYKVDRNLLTPDEVLSIVTALKGVNTSLNDRKFRDIEEKMKSLIPEQAGREIERLEERMVIDFSPWGGNAQVKHKIELIQRALEETRLLEFDYTTAEGNAQRRVLEPMTLVLKGYAWYLWAYCREREDYRLFRLSRARKIQMLTEGFVRREKAFEGFVDSQERIERTTVNMVLKFAPRVRVRAEDLFEGSEMEVQEDGTLLVKVSYPEDDWVYGTLLSFGPEVEVVAPVHLREIIREKARLILQKYSGENVTV